MSFLCVWQYVKGLYGIAPTTNLIILNKMFQSSWVKLHLLYTTLIQTCTHILLFLSQTYQTSQRPCAIGMYILQSVSDHWAEWSCFKICKYINTAYYFFFFFLSNDKTNLNFVKITMHHMPSLYVITKSYPVNCNVYIYRIV